MITELKEQLEQEYQYRIEMHAHSHPTSPCSQIPPRNLVQIYHQLGYSAIALTNHYFPGLHGEKDADEAVELFLQGYEETRRAGEALGISVFLGAELRFDGSLNDYLLYGADREILGKAYAAMHGTIEAYHQEIQDPRSILFQAHPFRENCSPCAPNALDGIEVFNMHPNHNSRVGLAAAYAKKFGLRKIGGTDYHHPGHEGMAALRTKVLPKDSFALAEILRSGDYLLEIGGSIVLG